MTHALPARAQVPDLPAACRAVLANNESVGYSPTRFRQLVSACHDEAELRHRCCRLLKDDGNLGDLYHAIIEERHPNLLTLEDLVACYEYDLPDDVVEAAQRRARQFDAWVKLRRWRCTDAKQPL